jgi:hypothetical protein
VKLCVLVMAFVLVSCGSSATPPGLGIQAVTGTGEKDGVKIRIDLDKAVVRPGEVVWATLTIENTSDRTLSSITYSCDVAGEVYARPSALADYGEIWPEYELQDVKKRIALSGPPDQIRWVEEPTWSKRNSGGTSCTGQMRNLRVAPRTTLRSYYAWDGFVRPGLPAPNGTVDVMASFYMDNEKNMTGDGVGANVPLRVSDGSAVTVSDGRAIDAAIEEGTLRKWIEDRAKPDGYGHQSANDVEGSLSIDRDVWVIKAWRTATAGDPYPGGEIEVSVDAVSGAVISVVQRP